MRALKGLGVKPELYGSLLSSVLVQRLPQELRLIAGRQIRGDWTLFDIMKVVNQEPSSNSHQPGLGYSGPVVTRPRVSTSTNLVTHVLRVPSTNEKEEGRQLERKLKAIWELEFLGILNREHDIYDQFHQIVRFQDRRYAVSLPWKEPFDEPPNQL